MPLYTLGTAAAVSPDLDILVGTGVDWSTIPVGSAVEVETSTGTFVTRFVEEALSSTQLRVHRAFAGAFTGRPYAIAEALAGGNLTSRALEQLIDAHTTLDTLVRGTRGQLAVAVGGDPDTLRVTIGGAAGYVDGLLVAFRAPLTNTGAVTLEKNEDGPKPYKKAVGDDWLAGEIRTTEWNFALYNESDDCFYAVGRGGPAGGTGPAGPAGTPGTNGTNGTNGVDGAPGGGIALEYTFSTTTTDSDPGPGNLRLNNGTQNLATIIRADLAQTGGADVTALLDALDDSSSTVKGIVRLFRKSAPTTVWLTGKVTSVASPSGYRNITITPLAASATNPFNNGDAIVLAFTPQGDAGTASIGAGAVGTSELADDATTNTKLANMAAKTYKGRTTNSTGDPQDVAVAVMRQDLSLPPMIGYPRNLQIAASATANALTVALKTDAGADPSATDKIVIPFRATDGSIIEREVTGALAVTASSGSTFGTLANNAFRLWLVGFDNGDGSVTPALINCLSRPDNSVFGLAGRCVASATAEGGAGGADSAHVFYGAAAVSSRPYAVLGFVEYPGGLTTPGAYAGGPGIVCVFGPGLPLPGQVLKTKQFTTGTESTNNSTSYVATTLTMSFQLESPANAVRTFFAGALYALNGSAAVFAKLHRAGTEIGVGLIAYGGNTTAMIASGASEYWDFPNTTSSFTYDVRARSNSTGTAWEFPEASSAAGGLCGVLIAQEVMS